MYDSGKMYSRVASVKPHVDEVAKYLVNAFSRFGMIVKVLLYFLLGAIIGQ